MTPAAALRREDGEVLLDRAAASACSSTPKTGRSACTLDGREGALADGRRRGPAEPADGAMCVVAPIDLKMRSAIALRADPAIRSCWSTTSAAWPAYAATTRSIAPC